MSLATTSGLSRGATSHVGRLVASASRIRPPRAAPRPRCWEITSVHRESEIPAIQLNHALASMPPFVSGMSWWRLLRATIVPSAHDRLESLATSYPVGSQLCGAGALGC
jgi:hypothetical protein